VRFGQWLGSDEQQRSKSWLIFLGGWGWGCSSETLSNGMFLLRAKLSGQAVYYSTGNRDLEAKLGCSSKS
jgi:hypothetical protein